MAGVRCHGEGGKGNWSYCTIAPREAGDLPILLRNDTRYLEDGQVVGLASLKPNMRVFVNAGKGLYDEVEAYQIVWGRILSTR